MHLIPRSARRKAAGNDSAGPDGPESATSVRGAIRIAVGRAESPMGDLASESENYALLTLWALGATLLLMATFVWVLLAACTHRP
jgi:hypothetical protein